MVIPLWRPWAGAVLKHELKDSERNGYEWRIALSDLQSGRYIVKAVHAPWGCDDWSDAQAACKQAINVYPDQWKESFGEQQTAPKIDSYFQALLAHWYRSEEVRQPPLPPYGLTADEIKWFLDYVNKADMLEPIKIPKDGSGSLNIFCANPTATTAAYISLGDRELPEIWKRILPNPEVLTLELKEHDSCFIRDVAFHYTSKAWEETARKIKLRNKKRKLSDILAKWHTNLSEERPPVDEVIFLCENLQLFQEQSPACKREYEQLKTEYQRQEAV